MSDLLRDLRHAVRTLARRPGLAVMATVSLATGIGLTVTTYSFLNALYAGPKGIVHPEELVQVLLPMLKQSGVADLRRELAPLADAAGFAPTAARSVTAAGEERLVVELVTDNYFSVLGLIPAEGRALGPSDLTRPSGPAPIVISHALWQNRFLGGKVAGLASQLGTEPVVIVGVAPRGFRGMTPVFRADAWALAGTFGTERAREGFFSVLARLRPGATPIQVQRTIEATIRRPDFVVFGSNERVLVARQADSRFGSALLIGVLTAVVGLLLVVGCANVAGLLLARLDERRRELAIRTALGAGHWPIVRQLLAEGVVLSSAGSLAGLLLAIWLTKLALLGTGFFGFTAAEAVFDRSVLLLVCGLTTLETLAVSLAPIWFATRVDVATCLKGDLPSTRTGRTRVGFRDIYVTGQLAIAFMLLVAAGLAMKGSGRHTRSMATLLRDDVVVANIKLPEAGTGRSVTLGSLLDRARALAGAQAAALAEMPNPRQGSTRVIHARQASSAPDSSEAGWTSATASANAVSADYFRIVALRMVSGRTFSRGEESGAARSAIVSVSLARRLWPDANPLGRQVHLGETNDPPWDVVGVAEDPPLIAEGNIGFCFLPVAHSNRASIGLVVEAASPRLALAPAVASLVRSAPVAAGSESGTVVLSLADFIRQNDPYFLMFGWVTQFTLALALLACALTLAGFYATVSHVFSRRTAEIGIRIALGAGRWEVRWLVLRRALVLAWMATLVGLPIALAEGRFAPRGVFETRWTPLDALLGAALAVTALAVLAAYVPARRASAVNPTVALRCE